MEDAEVDIKGIVALLRRQLGLIVAVFVVVLGAALVVTLALPQRYTATALVIVDTTAKNLLDPDGSVVSAAGDTARVTSEVEIILSPAILAQVVDAMGLRWDPEFGSSETLMDPVLLWLQIEPSSADQPLSRVMGRFRNALSVERRGQTYVIAIAVESRDAPKSAELANAVADAYIGQQVQSKIASIAASQAVLDARVSNARATLLAAEEALARFLAEEVNGEQTRDDLPVERLTRLSELEQAAGLARSQHSTLLARSSELGIQADLQIADSRIVSRALPNDAPSFPNRRLILAMAGLAGLGLGVALAFLREHFIGGITTEGQAVSVLRLPVVAEIPRQRGLAGNEAMSVSDSVITVPLSPYSEAVRRMKAGIDRHLSQRRAGSMTEGRGMVIVFSSSVPLEGKTTLALSLARSYAIAGRKTLMIDCDLRAPSVHRHLGSEPRYGLLDYLTGLSQHEALASVIIRDRETGLRVLTGARPSHVPTDQLLASAAFDTLIQTAVERFEIVVIDTPPVLVVGDGTYVSRYADTIAFVVKWAETSQAEARAGLSRLEAFKRPDADFLVVLNQHESMRSSVFDRYMRNYQRR